MELLIIGCLAAAVLFVAFGITKIITWCFAAREANASRRIAEAALVARAKYGVNLTARDREIQATKRGDLLAAARYAEQADREYSVSMLDQEDAANA